MSTPLRKRPPSSKFGAPLFVAGFAEAAGGPEPADAGAPAASAHPARHIVVAGGGGSGSTGVANRVLVVPVGPGGAVAADPAAELATGAQACIKGAMAPDGRGLACGLTGGGLRSYVLAAAAAADGADGAAEGPALAAGAASDLGKKEATCVAFTPDGKLVVAGLQGGGLAAFAWPRLERVPGCEAWQGGEVSALAFGPVAAAAGGGGAGKKKKKGAAAKRRVVALVTAAGDLALWSMEAGGAGWRRGEASALPRAAGVAVKGCGFGLGDQLFTGLNGPKASFVAKWEAGAGGAKAVGRARAFADGRISAFAAWGSEKAGRSLVAAGSSEGEVRIFDGRNLATLLKVPKAHMIFTTDIAFSRDGNAVVSVSADASATCVPVPAAPRENPEMVLAFLVILLAFLLYKILNP